MSEQHLFKAINFLASVVKNFVKGCKEVCV